MIITNLFHSLFFINNHEQGILFEASTRNFWFQKKVPEERKKSLYHHIALTGARYFLLDLPNTTKIPILIQLIQLKLHDNFWFRAKI